MKSGICLLLVAVLGPICVAQDVEIRSPVIGELLPAVGSYGIQWETPRAAWMPITETAPKLDGALDDPCWTLMAPVTEFIVAGRNPVRPHRNRVWLCYDNEWLYVAGRFEKKNTKDIIAGVTEHGDVNVWKDDAFEIHIALPSKVTTVPEKHADKPVWVQFITNTLGTRFMQFCYRPDPEGRMKFGAAPWNDRWRSAARVVEGGWNVEIAIPWKPLGILPRAGGRFRAHMHRFQPSTYRSESWTLNGTHRPENFGLVHFGRRATCGVEIQEARILSAGGRFTTAVTALVPGATPIDMVLSGSLRKDGKVIEQTRGQPIRVGGKPVSVNLPPLNAEESGSYEVRVQLTDARGNALMRGRAYGRRRALLERFFLFRHEYLRGEKNVRGYYRLSGLFPDNALKMRLQLATGSGATVAEVEKVLTTAEGQFGFSVPPLKGGTYKLHFRLSDARGKQWVHEEHPLHVKSFNGPERERVHFRVSDASGVRRSGQPVTVGIPFGKGMLAVRDVDAHLRILDAVGRELPCQKRVLATWTDAGRYARWVLADFQGHSGGDGGSDFHAEFGNRVRCGGVSLPPLVREDDNGRLTVDTGPLTMVINKNKPLFFGGVSVGGKPVTQAPDGGEMYLKLADPEVAARLMPRQYDYRHDRSLKTYLAELAANDCEVEVETNGPFRSVIRASGWYAAEDGTRLFKYILRLYVYRGKATVGVFHTFIVTKSEQYVDSMGIRIQRVGGARPGSVAFGLSDGEVFHAPFTHSNEDISLLQPSSEYFRILEYPRGTVERGTRWGTQRAAGRRAPGWCDATWRGGPGMTLAVKDFWQEYPKQLSITAGGTIDIGIVSGRSAAHMDLRGSVFGKEEFAVGNSEGVAKTTRFTIAFHAPDEDKKQVGNRARALLAEPVIWIDPEWLQKADPFWFPVARCTTDSDDQYNRAFANFVEMYNPLQPQAPEVVSGLYRHGILNYGDRIHTMVTRGYWNNEDYALGFSEWVAYLATGNPDILDAVRSFSRHIIDVDTLNYTSGDEGCLGLQSRHRRLHWGQPACITHTYVDQSLLYYYLFGYERGADHADLIRRGQKVWKWWPASGWYSAENPGGAVTRDFMVNLRILMNTYRHCWDPVLLVRAHEMWRRYVDNFTDEGRPVEFSFSHAPRPAELYARTTGDPSAAEIILKSPTPNACPVFCAQQGKTDNLAGALAEFENEFASSYTLLPVPWWALRHTSAVPLFKLRRLELLGYRETLERSGMRVPVRRAGKLEFRDNQDILLLEEKDAEHKIRIETWFRGRSMTSAVTIFAPNGDVVATKTYNPKELPTHADTKILTLRIPRDGQAGVYLVRGRNLPSGYSSSWLAGTSMKRAYRVAPESFWVGTFGSARFWFYVPKECGSFRIGAVAGNRSYRFGFTLFDDAHRFVAAKAWYNDPHIAPAGTQWLDVEVPEDKRGTWWSLASTSRKGIRFIWPKELPRYLADSPASGFIPDPAKVPNPPGAGN